jgi:hypothetical protein
MPRLTSRNLVVSVSGLLALATAWSCSSSPSSPAGSDGGGEGGGSGLDAAQDGPNDSSSRPESSAADGSPDAGVESGPAAPPHVVFLTSDGFTGDLVGAANALVADGGAPAPDGGGTYGASDWQSAADALCQHAARRASLPSGTYWALLSGHSGATPVDAFARLQDSDGPWALVDGTPVADTVAHLSTGVLWASIDVTESGNPRTFDATNPNFALAWAAGVSASDCNGWTAATTQDGGRLTGVAGSSRVVFNFYFDNVGGEKCTQALPLYCAQVGAGAGPLVKRSLPAGAKIAFTTSSVYHGDLAASFTADGGVVPDGGADAVHAAADAICNAEAAAGKAPGTYRAWVSSSTSDAKTYFAAHAMNGPWYRPDGILVAHAASNLSDANGIATQLVLGADGTFAGSAVPATATDATGAYDPTNNCSGFTTAASTSTMRAGRNAYKDVDWASSNYPTCDYSTFALYCFEQ